MSRFFVFLCWFALCETSDSSPRYYEGDCTVNINGSGVVTGMHCKLESSSYSSCFSVDSVVAVLSNSKDPLFIQEFVQEKPISNLSFHEKILDVASDTLALVASHHVTWFHHDYDQAALFLQLYTVSTMLEITGNHYVYVLQKGRESVRKRADDVRLGDFLFVLNQSHPSLSTWEEVVRAQRIEKRGVFAPLSSSGNLFVNRVLVSSYVELDIEALASGLFKESYRYHSLLMRLIEGHETEMVDGQQKQVREWTKLIQSFV
jgi:hypothetical protein